MAVFATTGKNKGVKRIKARFGGDSAWRQHDGDEKRVKQDVALARRRAESQHVELLMGDFDAGFDTFRPSDERCSSTGIKVPVVLNGSVREGNILLVFAKGKLLSAHCG